MKLRPIFLSSLLSLLGLFLPAEIRGQVRTYTTPATVSNRIANNFACDSSSHSVNVTNIGQSSHFVFYTVSPATLPVSVEIDSFELGIPTRISDLSSDPTTGLVTANGYYSVVQVTFTCQTGQTINVSYEGLSSTSVPTTGLQDVSAYKRTVANGTSTALSAAFTIPTPYGNSCGQIIFSYGSAVAGSTLTVSTNENSTVNLIPATTLVNGTSVQTFTVPCTPSASMLVTFTTGGAGGNYKLLYLFNKPGSFSQSGTYTHVTTTTATAAKATGGFLHTLNVNTAAAGTISIFDLATAACTGTPATNIVAVITVPAATNGLPPFVYDVAMNQGVCVKASVAMDFPVSTN